MKGKAAMMGATIAMAAAVAMVVLLLLAELYCTLLLRKRRRPTNTTVPTSTDAASSRASLCSFYAQGVICAPRSFLFPASPPEDPSSEKQLFHNNLRYSSSPDSSTTSAAEQLIYICNPMYDGEEGVIGKGDTPFETPTSSPSHLDIESGSGSGGSTPPMNKLQESVPLRDGRSICTTPSDSNTIFGGASSSSLASPCSNSPSW